MDFNPAYDQPSTISVEPNTEGYVRLFLEDPLGAMADSYLTAEEAHALSRALRDIAVFVEATAANL